MCSQTLILIDERHLSQPLLSWRHHMSHVNSPVHLDNLLLDNHGTHVVACANSTNSGLVYQFSTKLASSSSSSPKPVSFEFTRELDDFTNLVCELNNSLNDYDSCFDRAIRSRLIEQPTIGFSHLKSSRSDSFSFFRVRYKKISRCCCYN